MREGKRLGSEGRGSPRLLRGQAGAVVLVFYGYYDKLP